MSKSSQDVRTHILALRDELIDNLEMIRAAIRADREIMQAYFKQFGDFRYRPVTARDVDGRPTGWGTATEVMLEPLAAQMRTTVKSLIDSIRVIESEILPEDNPEGASTLGSGSEAKRAALRAEFKAQGGTSPAGHSQALPAPIDSGEVDRTPREVRDTPVPTKLVEKSKPTPRPPLERKVEETQPRETSTTSGTSPKPWRETTPRAKSEATHPVVEARVNGSEPVVEERSERSEDPKPQESVMKKVAPGAIGLSPKLRAALNGMVAASRMDAMKAKYGKKGVDED